jgi:hypothetical protein
MFKNNKSNITRNYTLDENLFIEYNKIDCDKFSIFDNKEENDYLKSCIDESKNYENFGSLLENSLKRIYDFEFSNVELKPYEKSLKDIKISKMTKMYRSISEKIDLVLNKFKDIIQYTYILNDLILIYLRKDKITSGEINELFNKAYLITSYNLSLNSPFLFIFLNEIYNYFISVNTLNHGKMIHDFIIDSFESYFLSFTESVKKSLYTFISKYFYLLENMYFNSLYENQITLTNILWNSDFKHYYNILLDEFKSKELPPLIKINNVTSDKEKILINSGTGFIDISVIDKHISNGYLFSTSEVDYDTVFNYLFNNFPKTEFKWIISKSSSTTYDISIERIYSSYKEIKDIIDNKLKNNKYIDIYTTLSETEFKKKYSNLFKLYYFTERKLDERIHSFRFMKKTNK